MRFSPFDFDVITTPETTQPLRQPDPAPEQRDSERAEADRPHANSPPPRPARD